MPSLVHMLKDTMLFEAARGRGYSLEEFYNNRLPGDAPIQFGPPKAHSSTDPEEILQTPIWHWSHDAAEPRTFRDLTVASRGMSGQRMTVCEKVTFEDVKITLRGGKQVILPLEAKFLVRKWFLRSGRIDGQHRLWPLEAETDPSLLLVFAFRLTADGPQPMLMAEIHELDGKLMPGVSQGLSLLFEHAKVSIRGRATITATVASPCFIVAASVTTCKERNDCEPAQMLGAARLLPHVMVVANTGVEAVEAMVSIARPPVSVHARHDPEMASRIGAVYFTDTNSNAAPLIPRWSEIFDYYETEPGSRFESYRATHPSAELGEVCFADHRAPERIVPASVQRQVVPDHPYASESAFERDFYGSAESITKVARQGAFDNIHVAPVMKLPVDVERTESGVAMAPFCVHDCLHTHVRWGVFRVPPNVFADLPIANRGFDGDRPNAKVGAPLVPENQSVFIRLRTPSSFAYRAVAHDVPASTWQIFMHHGSYFAIAPWPRVHHEMAPRVLMELVGHRAWELSEPYSNLLGAAKALPRSSWAAFYWRLRFSGWQPPWNPDKNHVRERLIFDLQRCMEG